MVQTRTRPSARLSACSSGDPEIRGGRELLPSAACAGWQQRFSLEGRGKHRIVFEKTEERGRGGGGEGGKGGGTAKCSQHLVFSSGNPLATFKGFGRVDASGVPNTLKSIQSAFTWFQEKHHGGPKVATQTKTQDVSGTVGHLTQAASDLFPPKGLGCFGPAFRFGARQFRGCNQVLI